MPKISDGINQNQFDHEIKNEIKADNNVTTYNKITINDESIF